MRPDSTLASSMRLRRHRSRASRLLTDRRHQLLRMSPSRIGRNEEQDPRTQEHDRMEVLAVRTKHRCECPTGDAYERYGGRGITVCERWRTSFAAFFEDMGKKPSAKHSIDRVDNDLGYRCGKPECVECGPLGRSPNCRWATRSEQARNRRSTVVVRAYGVELPAEVWSERSGIAAPTIRARISAGWSGEDAVSLPPDHKAHGRRS